MRAIRHMLRATQLHGVGRVMFLLAFLCAQIAVSAHHTGEAHASDDGLLIECDVCTVSSNVYDAPSGNISLPVPLFERSHSVVSFNEVPRTVERWSGGARAPPKHNKQV